MTKPCKALCKMVGRVKKIRVEEECMERLGHQSFARTASIRES